MMKEPSVRLTLSHHKTTGGLAYQQVMIELVSRDRLTTPAVLPTLTLPPGLDPRKGVLLSGRAPVWLYAHLVHECHPTLWVACFDPRLGAVVTSTHSAVVRVGQVIPMEVLNLGVISAVVATPALGLGLLIVGPPDSGKSVLSHQLFSSLVADYPNIYLQRSHWDGEGNWILELPETATDAEREAFKQANKGGLTAGFFPYQGEAISSLRRQKDLVIVDVGGMVQPEKQVVLEACTHYVIISSQRDEVERWHAFCHGKGRLQPLAVVHSTLEEGLEIVQQEPFLEIVCGPWVMGQTVGVLGVLREAVVSILVR